MVTARETEGQRSSCQLHSSPEQNWVPIQGCLLLPRVERPPGVSANSNVIVASRQQPSAQFLGPASAPGCSRSCEGRCLPHSHPTSRPSGPCCDPETCASCVGRPGPLRPGRTGWGQLVKDGLWGPLPRPLQAPSCWCAWPASWPGGLATGPGRECRPMEVEGPPWHHPSQPAQPPSG